MRRVAITGVGAISALGRNVSEFAEALRQGRCGIGPIESTDRSQLRFQNGAEVKGYSHQPYFEDRRADFMDRFAQFAVIAAREAVENSGVVWTPELRENAAIITGSCVGGQSTEDIGFQEIYWHRRNRVHPLTIPKTMANAGASHISMEFGITGPSFTISTACSSAGHAIGQAFWMVRTGATELGHHRRQRSAVQLRNPESLGGHARGFAGDLPPVFQGPARHDPGRRRRHAGAGAAGSRAGPGRADSRRDRRLRHVLRRLPHHAAFRRRRRARAMRAALRDAGLAPEQIGYINAHGTATPANDPTETAAIRAVFGAHANRLAVSSTKSMHGHALGAAAALECLAAAIALRDGVLPPTANFTEPDPECDLDVIPNVARNQQVEYALSNSFAFGGLNAVLALRAT